MTDVSNLDDLAAKIASGKYPNIATYAKAQAAATQSQEVELRKLREDVEMLKRSVSESPPGGVGGQPTTPGSNAAGYLRYGGLTLQSHTTDYAIRIQSRLESDENRPNPTFLYKNPWGAHPTETWYGPSAVTCRANGWLAHHSGAEMSTAAGVITQVADPDYIQAFATQVISHANTLGYSGIFWDNMMPNMPYAYGGFYPDEYPNITACYNATVTFSQTAYPLLQAAGLKVCSNAFWFDSANAGSDNGQLVASWWTAVGPYSDYIMNEGWVIAEHADNPNPDKVRLLGPSAWYRNWEGWQALVSHAYTVGSRPVCLSWGGTTTRRLYTAVSFLIDWDSARGGAWIHAIDEGYISATDQWTGVHDSVLSLGRPVAAKTQSGNTWSRQFEHGTVTIDPSLGTASITGA